MVFEHIVLITFTFLMIALYMTHPFESEMWQHTYFDQAIQQIQQKLPEIHRDILYHLNLLETYVQTHQHTPHNPTYHNQIHRLGDHIIQDLRTAQTILGNSELFDRAIREIQAHIRTQSAQTMPTRSLNRGTDDPIPIDYYTIDDNRRI